MLQTKNQTRQPEGLRLVYTIGRVIEKKGQKKREVSVGNGLLSHAVTHILPSALVNLTAGFGMEPGVPSPL